jgi:predicted transcriptional regulator
MDETTLTIGVASRDQVKRRMRAAFRGQAASAPSHLFASHELLLSILTPSRWAILQALMGAGPVGVRELARRVGRDVSIVHADAQKLVLCGLIRKDDEGKLEFPYRSVRVEFAAQAA